MSGCKAGTSLPEGRKNVGSALLARLGSVNKIHLEPSSCEGYWTASKQSAMPKEVANCGQRSHMVRLRRDEVIATPNVLWQCNSIIDNPAHQQSPRRAKSKAVSQAGVDSLGGVNALAMGSTVQDFHIVVAAGD